MCWKHKYCSLHSRSSTSCCCSCESPAVVFMCERKNNFVDNFSKVKSESVIWRKMLCNRQQRETVVQISRLDPGHSAGLLVEFAPLHDGSALWTPSCPPVSQLVRPPI